MNSRMCGTYRSKESDETVMLGASGLGVCRDGQTGPNMYGDLRAS